MVFGSVDQSSLDLAVARVPPVAWRAAGAVVTAGALAWRLSTRHEYRSAALFWLETAVPMLILAAYLTRPPPVRPARGFDAIVLPFVAAVLPFAFLYPPFTAWGRAHIDLFILLLIPPTALMVAGYLALNRNYSLMAEARQLVTHGPYAYLRHPIYTAQLACAAVVVAFRFSWVSVGVYLVFAWIQGRRAKAEEAALADAFPSLTHAPHVPENMLSGRKG